MGDFHTLVEQLPEASLVTWDSMAIRGTLTVTTPRFIPTALPLVLAGLRIDPTLQEGAATIGALKEPVILTMFS